MLLQFLSLFDVYEGKVAEQVLQAIFDVKPELVEDIDFGGSCQSWFLSVRRVATHHGSTFADEFYQTLSPHSAFVAKTYFNHLRKLEDPRLGDLEPVVTALAYFVQAEWTKLVVLLEAEERDEEVEQQQEFVVDQLVGMTVNVDYGDEIGRRKMFELMRSSNAPLSLPAHAC